MQPYLMLCKLLHYNQFQLIHCQAASSYPSATTHTCIQSFATEQVSEMLPCTYITLMTSKCLLGSSNLQSVVQASMHMNNCQNPLNLFMQDCRYYKNNELK